MIQMVQVCQNVLLRMIGFWDYWMQMAGRVRLRITLVIQSGTFTEYDVRLEAASLFLQGRGKAVYTLPSSDPTLALLLVGFTEYDDDDDDSIRYI
ncbi:hypothetical protein HanRHA438_Chr03g0131061 [Helianthus annuus]|nr:hypothetical protein HanRHA438_Chr03g0131061 [Helianthus annuus]